MKILKITLLEYTLKIFIIIFFSQFYGCNKNEPVEYKMKPPAIIQDSTIKDINYNAVVDKGTFDYTLTNGKSGKSTVMYIVVDKNSTQDEVKKLANKLWYDYQSSDMISIAILTDYKAALNYENWDYDLSDSWLLLVNKNYKDNTIQYESAFDKLPIK
jgi:hypothetical protein